MNGIDRPLAVDLAVLLGIDARHDVAVALDRLFDDVGHVLDEVERAICEIETLLV